MSTGISWTDETWNPVVGCTYASEGCRGCYAARDAFGRLSHTKLYGGLAVRHEASGFPRFTGEVRLVPERLDQPLRWQRPRRVFVNSMSDLFHPDVDYGFIVNVFGTMARARQHTFQVLTKRPQHMASIVGDEGGERSFRDLVQRRFENLTIRGKHFHEDGVEFEWPLSNVWLGTSVESQRWADLRVPHLLQVPAAVRFLSVEPLLAPIDLSAWLETLRDDSAGWLHEPWLHPDEHPQLHWVIAGGESGPRSRPMHPNWVRTIRDQCRAAGVAFHFKQWGAWAPSGPELLSDEEALRLHAICVETDGTIVPWLNEPLYSPAATMVLLGAKHAGHELDGEEHQAFPA